ncbi:MAG: type II toxin-antitoxin system RelE/ParE family toxin [Acidobacteria bacterium]|nr:type II toxin-antitoxin system RelE/ParE family toxin [Acidobacteriota bacterium]
MDKPNSQSNQERWAIDFHKTVDGRSPVEEFIRSLPDKARAKVNRTIELLATLGFALPMPHNRKVQGVEKLWELRVQSPPQIHRIFYFATVGRRFILLHGFTKKTEKTPPREIQVAVTRMKDFSARKRKQR